MPVPAATFQGIPTMSPGRFPDRYSLIKASLSPSGSQATIAFRDTMDLHREDCGEYRCRFR
jgi:hypothetical protein